jgi:hypothetical protein
MAKKYVFVRMPLEIYKSYKAVQLNMQRDITNLTGKKTPLPMPKVFKAIISPHFNENFIQVDLKKLVELSRKKRGEYYNE